MTEREQMCAVVWLPAGHVDACGDCDPCIDALATQAVDRIFKTIEARRALGESPREGEKP